jgi:hypothetical protein
MTPAVRQLVELLAREVARELAADAPQTKNGAESGQEQRRRQVEPCEEYIKTATDTYRT